MAIYTASQIAAQNILIPLMLILGVGVLVVYKIVRKAYFKTK